MDRLRRSRGVLRAAATRLISSATEALQAEHPSPSDLQVILDDLQDKDSALAALNEMIADLMDDGDEYEAEATVALEYHDKIRNTMSRVRFILNSAARAGDSATQSVLSDTATQGVSTQASSRAPLHRVALPKLQVPVFSGELREWQGFWEHFEATIHNNRELSDIEKFSYLRSYLTGTAKRAIEGVRLAEANYAVAVKMLRERFGRHTALVDDHIDCLLAIAPIDRSSQVSQLRELYEEVHFRTSCLDSLGVPASEYAVILHRVLMRSLPEDIAILYRQRMKETEPDDGATPRSRQEEVRKVMKFQQVQVESREESQASCPRCLPKTTSAEQGQCRPCLPPPVPSALALAAGSASNDHPCCVLCNNRDHTIKDCHATLSAYEIRHRQISARNRSPETCYSTTSATRPYVKTPTRPYATAPILSAKRLTFIDQQGYITPTTASPPPPETPDDSNFYFSHGQVKVCDILSTAAPPIAQTPSVDSWASVPSWWDGSSNRNRWRRSSQLVWLLLHTRKTIRECTCCPVENMPRAQRKRTPTAFLVKPSATKLTTPRLR